MQKITLTDYKNNLPEPLKPRTLCFLMKDNKILLGKKKKGFGQGNFLGIGGKVEPGESIEQAMIRETVEEIGVIPTDFNQVGVLDFYFPYVDEPKKWNQRVHIFLVKAWNGKPRESEEIYPEWFNVSTIPLDHMWSDAPYWLPNILRGEKVNAEFTFDKNLEVEEKNIPTNGT